MPYNCRAPSARRAENCPQRKARFAFVRQLVLCDAAAFHVRGHFFQYATPSDATVSEMNSVLDSYWAKVTGGTRSVWSAAA
jgi:hypothetical protein